jgi:aryl-alcohol dehydrogenase-like predicted oxidoreductase
VEYRRLGRTDLNSSVIGFGCGRIASLSSLQHRKEIVATLHQALETGINFFDTADSYGQGDSERLLGRLVHGRRQQVIICTKVGYRFGGMHRLGRLVKTAAAVFASQRSASVGRASSGMRSHSPDQTFTPEYINASIEGSLRRLRSDYVDLFLLHSPPRDVIAEGSALYALELLQREGLVRHYGVSCSNKEDALACLEHPGISILEVACNLFDSSTNYELLARAVKQQVAIIAREPFTQGRVLRDPRLQQFVQQHPGRTLAQTALRAVMQLPGVDVVLPGMTRRPHLAENVGAVTAPLLNPDEMDMLCGLAPVLKEVSVDYKS